MSRLGDLWDELLRRRVVRVAVAYAAVVFVVIQAGDIVFPALGLPAWTMTLVVVLAGLGFPVVVALAWAFDVGPGGIQRTPADPEKPGVKRASLMIPVAAALGLVIVLVGGWALLIRDDGSDQPLDAGLVAVIPFRVSGDASVEYLREGMVDLLAASLTGEAGPRAADPRTTLSAWRRVVDSEAEDLPPDRAMDVARAIGAGHVLLGSIVGTSSRLTLSAKLIRLPDGREGDEARAEGPVDSLTALVDRVTAQLLSLEAGVTNKRLASFTSTSLPAVRAYLRGQSLFRRSRFTDSRRAFDEALQLDSTFALAALGLRLTSGWGGASVPLLSRAPELAWRYRDRLAAPDRAILDALLGTDSTQTRNVRERLEDWERTVERYPDRPEAWFQYGDELAHRGALADEPDVWGRANAAFGRALQLDSSFTPALIHLMDGVLAFGPAFGAVTDTLEFRRLHAILARGDASPEVAEYQHWARVFGLGDTAGIRMLRAAMDTSPGLQFWASLYSVFEVGTTADLERAVEHQIERTTDDPRAETAVWAYAHRGLVTLGRPQAARSLLDRAIAAAADSTRWLAEAVLDGIYADGDSTFAAAAANRLERWIESRPSADPEDLRGRLCTLGQWRAWSGVNVATIADRLEAGDAQSPARLADRFCADLLRAVQAVVTGSPEAAVRLARLDAEAGTGPPIGEQILLQVNMSLARLHDVAGDRAAALRAIRRRPGSANSSLWYPTALEEEGRLAAAADDREAAIRAWSRWLRLRDRAEPSLQPRIDRVRSELARLTGENGT